MTRLAAALAFACALLATMTVRAAGLEVIELRHRLYDELRPLLEPLLEPGATLTGSGDKLILKTSPGNLAEIRAALAALDVQVARLRVSVSHARLDDAAWDAYGVEAGVAGERGGVAIGRPPGGPGIAVDARIARTHARDEGTQLQSVLTMDGGSAWIADVDARPQPYVEGRYTPYGPLVQQGIEWQEAQSGFYVTPRLRGDEVEVEISSQRQAFAEDNGGRLATSGVDTVVTGRLGEWLPLGGTAETTAGADGELIAHTRRQANTHTGIWLRVDRLP